MRENLSLSKTEVEKKKLRYNIRVKAFTICTERRIAYSHLENTRSMSSSFVILIPLSVIMMVPLSGSGLILISKSPISPRRAGLVTLKNLNLSRASIALLIEWEKGNQFQP